MSLEKNKAIVLRTIEAINAQDLSVIDDIVASDFIDHTRQMHGPEGIKQFLTMVFKSFPDFHLTIKDIIAEGDKVWIRSTITATHTGEFTGLTPTGNKFIESSVWIYRIIEGKIIAFFLVSSFLGRFRMIKNSITTTRRKTTTVK